MIGGFDEFEGFLRVWGMNAKCDMPLSNLLMLRLSELNKGICMMNK